MLKKVSTAVPDLHLETHLHDRFYAYNIRKPLNYIDQWIIHPFHQSYDKANQYNLLAFYRALLIILNAPSYHCNEIHSSPVPDSYKLWREAIGIKYGGKYGIKADPYGNDPVITKGKLPKLPYGKEEFEKLLENYGVSLILCSGAARRCSLENIWTTK